MRIDPDRPGFIDCLLGRAGLGLMIYARFCATVIGFLAVWSLYTLTS